MLAFSYSLNRNNCHPAGEYSEMLQFMERVEDMKSKRVLLVLIVAVIIAFGWLMGIKSVRGVDAVSEQKLREERADWFMERELYVRAIPMYKEALTYSTDNDARIQEKLLDAYMAYEDFESYEELAGKRVSAGTATEEECMIVAEYLLNEVNLNKAMTFVKGVLDSYDFPQLREYYEANRYAFSTRSTKYTEIIPTAGGNMMPAYDGEKWGYINSDADRSSVFAYDAVTKFNSDGYAAVSVDGKVYTILGNGDRYGVDETGLDGIVGISGSRILGVKDGLTGYYDYDFSLLSENHRYDEITVSGNGRAAVCRDGRWGIIDDKGDFIKDIIYDDVAVNSLGSAFAQGVAMVCENGMWHMIDTEGNTIGTDSFHGARAPEDNGYIAVADEDGKWGFIDLNGNLVIDYQYNDAYSFSDGVAAVQKVSGWGYISVRNQMAIDDYFTSANPFHNGIAIADIEGEKLILSLTYRE